MDGRKTLVIEAAMDVEDFLNTLPESLRTAEDEAPLKEALEGWKVKFWVREDDRRIVQFAQYSARGDSPAIKLDFESPVDVPVAVESMPADEADRLGQETEIRGTTLLKAVGKYFELHASYPLSLDPVAIAEVLDPSAWPLNAFTGRPMKDSTDAGDFEYVVNPDGTQCELRVHGWYLVQMYYSSERFGPIYIGP